MVYPYQKFHTNSCCSIDIETKRTRSICPICREKLKAGDKSIRFIADWYYGRITFRKFHIVCWLSHMGALPSTKELGMAKRRIILEEI